MKKMATPGTGYVGLSSAMLLAQHNEVVAVDVVHERVAMLNDRKSPIIDAEIEGSLRDKPLNFRAALNREDAYCSAEFVAVATPTDYDPKTNIQHSQR